MCLKNVCFDLQVAECDGTFDFLYTLFWAKSEFFVCGNFFLGRNGKCRGLALESWRIDAFLFLLCCMSYLETKSSVDVYSGRLSLNKDLT